MKAKSILQPRTERNGTIKLRSWEQVNKFKEEGGKKEHSTQTEKRLFYHLLFLCLTTRADC